MRLSETLLSYLKMYSANTHGLEIPYSIAKTLEIKGLIEWIPPQFGTKLWAITAKGRSAVASQDRGSL